MAKGKRRHQCKTPSLILGLPREGPMILLRHGQTIFNAVFGLTRIDPGIADPGLTAEGRRQIRAAAEGLSGQGLRRVVASPYARALETAEILVSRLGLPVAVEPLIGERGHFVCDIGTARSRLLQRWPQHQFSDFEEEWWRPGESEDAFAHRCRHFRQAVAALEDWGELLVVTHWGVIRGLTGHSVANGEWVRFNPRQPPAQAED